MTFTAFGLAAAAAVLHAGWNLWVKKASGTVGVFWLALCIVGLALAPIALFTAPLPTDPGGLACLLVTGLIHAGYFALLTVAYRHGEMSVVYPLSRGTAVAGIALIGWAVLGERPRVPGATGIGLLCAGIVLLGLPGRRPHGGLALLVGLLVTGYSVVDKLGVGRMHPTIYAAGLSLSTAIFLAPYAWLACPGQCGEAWRRRKTQALLLGLASMGTYLLVLYAFRLAPASYVVAVRESSIAVAVVLGVVAVKERLTVRKAVAVLAILVGVVLIKAG
jgi:drug/metabolite transporter (DMT)-like permease